MATVDDGSYTGDMPKIDLYGPRVDLRTVAPVFGVQVSCIKPPPSSSPPSPPPSPTTLHASSASWQYHLVHHHFRHHHHAPNAFISS